MSLPPSPPAVPPPMRDWKLRVIRDRGAGQSYRYEVQGENLNFPPTDKDYFFTWSVPNIDDERYDHSDAIRIPSDAPPLFHVKALSKSVNEITESQLRSIAAKAAPKDPATVALAHLASFRMLGIPVRIFQSTVGFLFAA